MALVAVNNKQPVRSYRLRMRIEVVKPVKREIVARPAIWTNLDNPVAWYTQLKPGRDQDLASKDNKGWDALPRRANSLY